MQKLSVLRACRRVLRPGGRLAFFTIFIPEGLSDDAYRRAVIAGASAIETPRHRQHTEMLASAGFVDISETDVTEEFLDIARRWFEARNGRADELKAALGESEFLRVQTESQATVSAIEAGLLRRSLFVARRP